MDDGKKNAYFFLKINFFFWNIHIYCAIKQIPSVNTLFKTHKNIKIAYFAEFTARTRLNKAVLVLQILKSLRNP